MKKLLLIALMLCGVARAQQAAVYFDFDSYKLTESAKAALDSTLATLKYYEGVRCSISGFTDDKGKPGYNDTLAIKRANAVKDYMLLKSPTHTFAVSSTKMEGWPAGTTDAQKRCVKIEALNLLECRVLPEYEQRYEAKDGVVVIGANFSGRQDVERPTIITSFSAEDMIANGRFGIDKDGNILKSWGMIDVVGGESEDGYYTIMVPVTEAMDPDMTIWLPQDEPDNTQGPAAKDDIAPDNDVLAPNRAVAGNTTNTSRSRSDSGNGLRWKNTDIKITKDKTGKYYTFRVPVSQSGRTSVNLDKPVNYTAGKGTRYKVIYVTTDKPYNFYKVNIGRKNSKVSFSAKINDTLYAFTAPYKVLVRNMDFQGYENGEDKPVAFRLARCRFKQDRQNNAYFTMTANTLKKPLKQETGFWAWLGRLFKNS